MLLGKTPDQTGRWRSLFIYLWGESRNETESLSSWSYILSGEQTHVNFIQLLNKENKMKQKSAGVITGSDLKSWRLTETWLYRQTQIWMQRVPQTDDIKHKGVSERQKGKSLGQWRRSRQCLMLSLHCLSTKVDYKSNPIEYRGLQRVHWKQTQHVDKSINLPQAQCCTNVHKPFYAWVIPKQQACF
jgi:hypothetical protein